MFDLVFASIVSKKKIAQTQQLLIISARDVWMLERAIGIKGLFWLFGWINQVIDIH